MATIAICLFGHNEAARLPRALESATWADQIVYVDCESTDASQEVARRYTDRIYPFHDDAIITDIRTFSFEQATTDWIFYLDPDEVIPPALAAEIRAVISSERPLNGYRLPRRNHVLGQWLRYGRQYPDTQLRLFRKGKAHFPPQVEHERLRVEGPLGKLREALHHFPVETPMAAMDKMNYYSTTAAIRLLRAGKRPTLLRAVPHLVLRPAVRFFRRYFLQRGFLDGWPGFITAFVSSLEMPFAYFKMWYFVRHGDGALGGRQTWAFKDNARVRGGATRLLTAVRFAAEQHRDHRRKGKIAAPYINHPIGVAERLAGAGLEHDSELLMAAVLHDVIEDTQATEEELTARFGPRVAAIVMEVTDDKSFQEAERKERVVASIAAKSKEARLLKLCDLIENVNDVIHHPPNWSESRKNRYFDWGERVVAAMAGIHPRLEREFTELVAQGRRQLKAG